VKISCLPLADTDSNLLTADRNPSQNAPPVRLRPNGNAIFLLHKTRTCSTNGLRQTANNRYYRAKMTIPSRQQCLRFNYKLSYFPDEKRSAKHVGPSRLASWKRIPTTDSHSEQWDPTYRLTLDRREWQVSRKFELSLRV
jgi:hypothetical protein